MKELQPGEAPTDPYDESWLYLIKPESLREKFMSTAKSLDDISPTAKIDDQPSTTLVDSINHDP